MAALFEPHSVAVLGASADPRKWGYVLARGALGGEHRRSVYLVNRRGGTILGRRAYESLAELPEAPELVVVAVPSAGFEEAVDASLSAGARAIVAISAGLGEAGGDGARREREVVERVRAAGALLLGPNCLGLFDAAADLRLSWGDFPAGAMALISQSGNLGLEIGQTASRAGLGISRFVSVGNQADVEAAELLDELAGHEPTRLIALYVEDFRDGRAFASAAQRAVDAGKPVVLLTAGRSDAGAHAARSHTGALVSDRRAVEAACRAAGMVAVSTPKELVDVAQALLSPHLPRGPRIAVVGDGGGHNALAADVVTSFGLALPELSKPVGDALAEALPPGAATRNPVDLAGAGEQDIASYRRIAATLLEADEVDAVLLTGYFGGYGVDSELVAARALAQAARASSKPLVVQTMFADAAAAAALRIERVPVYADIEGAARGLAALHEHALAVGRARQIPEVPPPALGTSRLELPASDKLSLAGYWRARELLASSGLRFPDGRVVHDPTEGAAAARELGYPLVLKALGLLHKSDAGGVVLGIETDEALAHAFADLEARLDPEEYALEQMAPLGEGVELIAGVRWDIRFGPIVLVGIGGLFTELLADVAVALAPVTEDEAEELLRSLRGAPLLEGARGRRPADVEAAARAVATVSRVGAERPDLAEIEINPLLVTPAGAVALDARAIVAAA